MVSDGGVESYLKTTRHLSVDRYCREGQALCLYWSKLGVHAGELLIGSRPGWSPNKSVSVRSLAISGSYAHVIQPSFWHAPLASPPSPDASGETDLQRVGSLGC